MELQTLKVGPKLCCTGFEMDVSIHPYYKYFVWDKFILNISFLDISIPVLDISFCIYPYWIYVFGYIHFRYIRLYPPLLYPQKDLSFWIYPKKDICVLDISGYISYIHGYRNSGYIQKRYICWIYPWI